MLIAPGTLIFVSHDEDAVGHTRLILTMNSVAFDSFESLYVYEHDGMAHLCHATTAHDLPVICGVVHILSAHYECDGVVNNDQ